MKILLSGGWGYGNLGDDAILLASINLLKEAYPDSQITVMSYDCDETRETLNSPAIRVIPSIHRWLSGTLAYHELGIWGKSHNFHKYPDLLRRITSKIWHPILSHAGNRVFRKTQKLSADLHAIPAYSEFESSDLFVMTGGGYFNSWLANLCARVTELKMARQSDTKSLLIGQSIGPFGTREISQFAYSGLKLAKLVSVRDDESLNEMISLGINCNVSPDLALSDIEFNRNVKNEISVIPGEIPAQYLPLYCQVLLSISKELNCTYNLLITRLYNCDIVSINKIRKYLLSHNLKANLIIPESYHEIQEVLSNSKVVISRNLHGLILGWRAGVPSVCLSDQRKFVSFMQQSRQTNRIMGLNEMSEQRLRESILQAYSITDGFPQTRRDLSNKIRQNMRDCLNKVMQ